MPEQTHREETTETKINVAVLKTEVQHNRQLLKATLAISGINFLALLIMILQLSNEIFKNA